MAAANLGWIRDTSMVPRWDEVRVPGQLSKERCLRSRHVERRDNKRVNHTALGVLVQSVIGDLFAYQLLKRTRIDNRSTEELALHAGV